MIEVDARGLSCPEPLMMAMDAVNANPGERVRVLVSNATARDNIKSVATRRKHAVAVVEDGADCIITID